MGCRHRLDRLWTGHARFPGSHKCTWRGRRLGGLDLGLGLQEEVAGALAFPGGTVVKNLPANAGDARDAS